jgi:hypothetical protein
MAAKAAIQRLALQVDGRFRGHDNVIGDVGAREPPAACQSPDFETEKGPEKSGPLRVYKADALLT